MVSVSPKVVGVSYKVGGVSCKVGGVFYKVGVCPRRVCGVSTDSCSLLQPKMPLMLDQ